MKNFMHVWLKSRIHGKQQICLELHHSGLMFLPWQSVPSNWIVWTEAEEDWAIPCFPTQHGAKRGILWPACFAKLSAVCWLSPLLSFSFFIIIIPGRGMKGLFGSQRKWLGWNLMARLLSGVQFFFCYGEHIFFVVCHRVLLPCKDVKLRNHEQYSCLC